MDAIFEVSILPGDRYADFSYYSAKLRFAAKHEPGPPAPSGGVNPPPLASFRDLLETAPVMETVAPFAMRIFGHLTKGPVRGLGTEPGVEAKRLPRVGTATRLVNPERVPAAEAATLSALNRSVGRVDPG